MPIILISVDSENKNLVEFDKMEDVIVDVMMESTDPRSKAIGDFLSKKMRIVNRLSIERLNERLPDESVVDAGIRLQAAVNVIRQMKVRTGVIISHKSTFDSWDNKAIKDEWDIIGMT